MAMMIARIDDYTLAASDTFYEFAIFYLSVLAFGINTVNMSVIEVKEF